MSRTLLSGGLIAGALAGLVVALLQFWLIQPLITEAERYETGELALPLTQTLDQPDTPTPTQHVDAQINGTDLPRAGLTVLFLTVTWCGFGLLAGAAMSAAQMSEKVRPFSAIGIAMSGFAVASVAPALGLPPELPGMPAADLDARQLWWIATFVATAAGLALAFRFESWAVRAAAIAVIALPHVVGAPTSPVAAPMIPPDLAALYVARVMGVSFLGWLVLGASLERLLAGPLGRALAKYREVLD
jgi:cobalt transporter subunit CbtA